MERQTFSKGQKLRLSFEPKVDRTEQKRGPNLRTKIPDQKFGGVGGQVEKPSVGQAEGALAES